MIIMRRSSAGYVKSLNEEEEYSLAAQKSRRWKKRLFRSSKQSSQKETGPSTSEKPLLEQVLSSDADDVEEIQHSHSSQSENSAQMSATTEEFVAEQQSPAHHEQQPKEDTSTIQEQSPSYVVDPVVAGVKKKLDTTKKSSTSPAKTRAAVTTVVNEQPNKASSVLPKSPPRTKSSDEMTKVRAALSRPFGRNSLPPHMASNWVVEVSPAEWDAEEERWKYRILVQRRTLQQLDESMQTAFTWRSLADFLWLEQALRAEYHGALLLPLLSIAIGTPDVVNFTQQDVDAVLLKDWLNDVLNGIRGQGMFDL